MADDFDFEKADEEFEEESFDFLGDKDVEFIPVEEESPTPTLDEAKERGDWESPEERDKALEEATDDYIKAHVGARVMIKYVGGFYDGQHAAVRKPLKKVMEVALPPKETSPGCFTNQWDYQAYYLRVVNDIVYYVEESTLMDFVKEYL